MPLYRWWTLIALVVGLGCLQVAQRTAVFLKGYGVGERTKRLHTQEVEVLWLRTQVVGLSSPAHLSDIAQARRLKFVAWSTLSDETAIAGSAVRMASLQRDAAD